MKIKKILYLITFNVFANQDCIDNSKHTYIKNGFDYKKYHKVICNCPCQRYPQLFDRGQCTKCGHFRTPHL